MRVENLTAHSVVVDCGRAGSVTIPPAGRMARVAEPAASETDVLTDRGTVREVVIRRSRSVSGLPPPRDGVVYLVPRLTALAACRRRDLVFPLGERRDEHGAVVSAQAIGRYAPRRSLRSWPIRAWRGLARGWNSAVSRDWLIGAGFAVATAVLGAALGVLPDLAAEGWTDPTTLGRRWALAVLGGVGVLVLGTSVFAWRRRNALQRRRGTAYIVKEEGGDWTRDESEWFLSDLRRRFARTLWVPGPDKLGRRWAWPLDGGAGDWDGKVDELVRSFHATRYNDDQQTANALFVWAHWSVAVAFGARSVRGQRDLVLDVRQRPSHGRMGELRPADWSQPPHRFRRGDSVPAILDLVPGAELRELRWPARVVISPRPSAPAGRPSDQEARPIRVLLARLIPRSWGPLPDVTAGRSAKADQQEAPPEDVLVRLEDAAGLCGPRDFTTTIEELRCLAPESHKGRFPWPAFPSLARVVTDWLARQAAADDNAVLLLGMLVPPEVALGLGIVAGQADGREWPERLWPIVHVGVNGGYELVVPRLDLGGGK